MTADFWGISKRQSSFFNAKYYGLCGFHDCYKRGDIEPGDGCEYYEDDLMHMRCARARQRKEKEK